MKIAFMSAGPWKNLDGWRHSWEGQNTDRLSSPLNVIYGLSGSLSPPKDKFLPLEDMVVTLSWAVSSVLLLGCHHERDQEHLSGLSW